MSKVLSIFLCYALEDKAFAREILSLIAQQRFQTYRTNRFTPEDRWQRDISDSQALVYILSHNARKSSLCIQQWKYAIKLQKPVLVLKLDDATVPDELRRVDTIDFLDFVEIGRQLADGVPSLRKDRYAIDVTLRMFVAELAELERKAGAGSDNGGEPPDGHTTLRFPPDDAELQKMRQLAKEKSLSATEGNDSPWKKIARRFRRLRGEGE